MTRELAMNPPYIIFQPFIVWGGISDTFTTVIYSNYYINETGNSRHILGGLISDNWACFFQTEVSETWDTQSVYPIYKLDYSSVWLLIVVYH